MSGFTRRLNGLSESSLIGQLRGCGRPDAAEIFDHYREVPVRMVEKLMKKETK